MKTERRDSFTKASTPDNLPTSPKIKQSDSPPPHIKTNNSPPPAPTTTATTMSDKQGSSSSDKDWNSLLKHSSALGILKPGIVFNSSYTSSSSSSSRYPGSYTSSSTGTGSSSIWSSSGVRNHQPPGQDPPRPLA